MGKKKAKAKPKYAKVRVQRFALDDLEDAPYNARTISQRALSGLSSSLEQLGLLALPVVNVKGKKSRIVAGHQRVRVLRERGDTHVLCVVVELTVQTERKANYVMNNAEIEGVFVPELTQALLTEIKKNTPEDAFKSLRFDALVREINQSLKPPKTATPTSDPPELDDAPALPAKTRADSKKGKLYQCGDHVVHCGPPKKRGTLIGFPAERASMGYAEIICENGTHPTEHFLNTHLGQLLDNVDGGIYIATDMGELPMVLRAFEELDGCVGTTVMFADSEATPDLAQPFYRTATLPVVYGWAKGLDPAFNRKSQGNFISIPRLTLGRTPVEVLRRLIGLSAPKKGWVLDVTGESGNPIVAAEKTGRRLMTYVRTATMCDRVRRTWSEAVHGPDVDWRQHTPVMD